LSSIIGGQGGVLGVHLVITVWFPDQRWFLLVILDLRSTIAVWAILTIIYPATATTMWTNLHCGTFHVELSPCFSTNRTAASSAYPAVLSSSV
jgi:hypothetical protein